MSTAVSDAAEKGSKMLKPFIRGHRVVWPSVITESRVVVLALLATIGFVVAAMTTAAPPSKNTAQLETRTVVTTAARTVTETVGIQPAREAGEPAPRKDLRYLVVPGDTLWGIAARYYTNVTVGMRTIKRHNRLGRNKVLAGETLVLPRVDRAS